MKAGSWVRTKLGDLKIGSGYFGKTYSALDMAFDYSTDTLYVLTDELKKENGGPPDDGGLSHRQGDGSGA